MQGSWASDVNNEDNDDLQMTKDGFTLFGHTVNADNSYKFYLVSDTKLDSENIYSYYDSNFGIRACNAETDEPIAVTFYSRESKEDMSPGWHCIGCCGNKHETIVMISSLKEIIAYRFENSQFTAISWRCDELESDLKTKLLVRGLHLNKQDGDNKYSLKVTRKVSLSECIMKTYSIQLK